MSGIAVTECSECFPGLYHTSAVDVIRAPFAAAPEVQRQYIDSGFPPAITGLVAAVLSAVEAALMRREVSAPTVNALTHLKMGIFALGGFALLAFVIGGSAGVRAEDAALKTAKRLSAVAALLYLFYWCCRSRLLDSPLVILA